jgi:hypothetical protein
MPEQSEMLRLERVMARFIYSQPELTLRLSRERAAEVSRFPFTPTGISRVFGEIDRLFILALALGQADVPFSGAGSRRVGRTAVA